MAKDLAAQIAIVEEALIDIRESSAADASPKYRAVRTKLETFERVVEGWQRRPPSEEQCRTLLECVMELHDEVFGRSTGGLFGTNERANASERARAAAEAPPSERPTRRAPEGPVPAAARPTGAPAPPSPESRGQRPTIRPGGEDD